MSLATQQAMDRMPSTVSMPIGNILHALKTNQIVEFVKDCPHPHCKKNNPQFHWKCVYYFVVACGFLQRLC